MWVDVVATVGRMRTESIASHAAREPRDYMRIERRSFVRREIGWDGRFSPFRACLQCGFINFRVVGVYVCVCPVSNAVSLSRLFLLRRTVSSLVFVFARL